MLSGLLDAASGADPALDARLTEALGAPPAAYTASVDAAIALVDHALPGWHWHIGWHADGITPYASLRDAARTLHVEAKGPTVQLALLRAMIRALEATPPEPTG